MNYFTRIEAPDLKPTNKTYGESVKSVFNAIDQNFQKISTLPFLKGESGDSLMIKSEHLWDTEMFPGNIDNTPLTQIGKMVYNAIFKDVLKQPFDMDPSILVNYNQFKIALSHILFNQTEAVWGMIGPEANPEIAIYYIQKDGKNFNLGLPQAYYFIDPRLNALTNNGNDSDENNESLAGFQDMSCVLTSKLFEDLDPDNIEIGLYNDGDYLFDIIKMDGWPTLYYKNGQFNWKINGLETGINAQGVRGRDGDGSRVWIAQCTLTEKRYDDIENDKNKLRIQAGFFQYPISKLYNPDPKEGGWVDINDDGEFVVDGKKVKLDRPPKDGDTAIVYVMNGQTGFNEDSPSGLVRPYVIIGSYEIIQNKHAIRAHTSNVITSNYPVNELALALNFIGQTITGDNINGSLQGLYLPTPHKPDSRFIVHTLYTENYDTPLTLNNPDVQIPIAFNLSPLWSDEVNTNSRINPESSVDHLYWDKVIDNYKDWQTMNVFYNTNLYSGNLAVYSRSMDERSIDKSTTNVVNTKGKEKIFDVNNLKTEISSSDVILSQLLDKSVYVQVSGPSELPDKTKPDSIEANKPKFITLNSPETILQYINLNNEIQDSVLNLVKNDINIKFGVDDVNNVGPYGISIIRREEGSTRRDIHFNIGKFISQDNEGINHYTEKEINVYSTYNGKDNLLSQVNSDRVNLIGDVVFSNGTYGTKTDDNKQNDYIYVNNYGTFKYNGERIPGTNDFVSNLKNNESLPSIDVEFNALEPTVNPEEDVIVNDYEIIITLNCRNSWYNEWFDKTYIKLFSNTNTKYEPDEGILLSTMRAKIIAIPEGADKFVIQLVYPKTVYQILKNNINHTLEGESIYTLNGKISLNKILWNGTLKSYAYNDNIYFGQDVNNLIKIVGQKPMVKFVNSPIKYDELTETTFMSCDETQFTNGFTNSYQMRLYQPITDGYKYGAATTFNLNFNYVRITEEVPIRLECKGDFNYHSPLFN